MKWRGNGKSGYLGKKLENKKSSAIFVHSMTNAQKAGTTFTDHKYQRKKLMNTRDDYNNNGKNWLVRHKTDVVKYGLILVAFLVGLALPSPFFRNGIQKMIGNKSEELVDTINMAIGGGIYSGSIVKNTCTRNGYGRFETQSGSVYEGEWKDDKLRFGTRTTASSVYTGRFDAELSNDGFGIINYTESYIKGKSSQGLSDSEIIVTYIGNWSKDNKQGLGRSIKKDGSYGVW